ncbi:enolase-phosphatase E1 [Salpingoeca rosetta]|uniref:Enolase-phosphatase E1 n=1 Tax=Salpingoeca rosetta (strain ATCC 50818 / BSB-021) TaxID=946362 RepID=F2UJ41_SALR5|nr:enolase-phosphatase E1 [Salpingoeca rosetta]EGD76989.1 enolase-phosphatase E1 [Salpingoeca rosetta]|eukprot:XP_004990829.1 enolase-phosphatase E1 [Salpingoeca rosetta]
MTTTVVKEDASVVLCDIEGTTTSIKFVKDVLFPYVRENLESYLERTWETAQTKGDVQALRDQWTADKAAGVEGAVPIPDGHTREVRDACVKSVRWQMDNDRKATALKQLQGHIWKDAYESGAVKGHVYDDVRPAMERWVADGIQVQVYSSGSVAAQKLLFKHSENGDMTKLLSGHYDTRIGGKMEAASYRRIAEEAMTKPNSILFLSDRIEGVGRARGSQSLECIALC